MKTAIDQPRQIPHRLPMAERDYSATSILAIASRLKLLRRAIAADNQAEFCRRMGFTTPAWNNYEKGAGRIGLDAAFVLCAKTGVNLDWIYRGVETMLPDHLLTKFSELKAQEKPRRRA